MRVPGDKSISHRALIFGALAVGRDPDRRAAGRRGRAQHRQGHAGARRDGRAHRRGRVARARASASAASAQPAAVLDFGNSGTGCRLVMGAVAGCPITATFDGDASLRKRPMQRVLDPLTRWARGRPTMAEGGRLPLTLRGRARSDPDRLPHAGAVGAGQVGGAARGARRAGRDHRDRDRGDPRPHRKMLAHFGADVTVDAGRRAWPPDHAQGRARARRRRRWWCRPIRPRPPSRWWRR